MTDRHRENRPREQMRVRLDNEDRVTALQQRPDPECRGGVAQMVQLAVLAGVPANDHHLEAMPPAQQARKRRRARTRRMCLKCGRPIKTVDDDGNIIDEVAHKYHKRETGQGRRGVIFCHVPAADRQEGYPRARSKR